MRSSRNSWIWCSGTSLMQFNLLISAELWRVCTIPTLWSVPMPSPGPRGRSPPRQWHFLPWNQRLPGVFSKSSDSCVLSNSLAGVIPSSSLLPMHWDLSPHTRASCCPLVQILALASNCCEMQPERGNVPYLHSHLLRKAMLKLCPSLPGPAQHGFSVWRHYDYFYFCISNAALNVTGNRLILGETNWTTTEKTGHTDSLVYCYLNYRFSSPAIIH